MVPESASALTSASSRWVQWSTAVRPSSQASCTPGPGPSWLACSRPCRPCRAPGEQDRARLLVVEGAAFAEGVDPARVRGGGFEHRAGDEVDVAGRVLGVLRGHDVGAEERRLLGELPRHREAPGLVEGGQAVAALDLDGGGALAPHLGDEPGDVGRELLVGRGAGGGHGGADAAGGVALPRHPGSELVGTVAGEDEVGVGVDEAGQHRATTEVPGRVGVGSVEPPADPHDPAALDHDRGILDEPERSPVVGRVVGDELGDPGEQQATSSLASRCVRRRRRWPRRQQSRASHRHPGCGWTRGRS